MLKRTLNISQIISLIMLFVGVSLIQLENMNYFSVSNNDVKNEVLGLICVVLASFLSRFAGVFFEKILKNLNVSIWIRNIQLSFLGSIFSIVTVFIYDAKNLSVYGFFHGYSYIVWINIVVQSGLLVAVVMKYAENILKGFATSLAIILSCIFSMYLFGTQINAMFFFVTLVVVLSVIFYSYTPFNIQTTLTTMPLSKDTSEFFILTDF